MKGGLPLFTVLPVVIDIQTTTAPLTRAKADAHPPDKPIFPAPPAIHSEITCKLVRKAVIRAQGQSTTVESDAAHLLGSLTDRAVDVDTELPEKQWQWLGDPDGDGKGSWFQRARFQVNVKLSVPPSFRIGTIECQVRVCPSTDHGRGVDNASRAVLSVRQDSFRRHRKRCKGRTADLHRVWH